MSNSLSSDIRSSEALPSGDTDSMSCPGSAGDSSSPYNVISGKLMSKWRSKLFSLIAAKAITLFRSIPKNSVDELGYSSIKNRLVFVDI